MWTEKDNGGLLQSTMWTENFLPNQIMYRMMGYFTLEKWYVIYFFGIKMNISKIKFIWLKQTNIYIFKRITSSFKNIKYNP